MALKIPKNTLKRNASVFLLAFFLSSGCASTLLEEMSVDIYLPDRDFEGALADLEGNREVFGERNKLLYLLNRGSLLFYAEEYEESNVSLLEANSLVEELYTKRISVETAALINPNLTPYEGEDYEQIMINVFAAFNYISLGELEEAGVEARIINNKLQLLSQRYDADDKYKNDALGRYLSGLIYEAGGDINNAYVSYKLAYEAYLDYRKMFGGEVPVQLMDDILRLSKRMGFRDQYQYYLDEFGFDPVEYDDSPEEIVIIVLAGMGPVKRELETTFSSIDKDGKTHTFQLQVPELLVRESLISEVFVGASRDTVTEFVKAEIVEDIGSIAAKNMSDKMPGILIKAWMRALAKHVATEKAKEKMDSGSGIANFIISGITDEVAEEMTHADLRCWRTLPDKIYMRRLKAGPGHFRVRIDFIDNEGFSAGEACWEEVEVRKGGKAFLFATKFI